MARRVLLWDFYRSWLDRRAPSVRLFTVLPAPAHPEEPVAPSYEYGDVPFRFEQYGVLLEECPRGYVTEIMRGVTATFCVSGPDKDVFSFPNANARWATRDIFGNVGGLRRDAPPPQGLALVADVAGKPIMLPPYQAFHVRLDFKQNALDALWSAAQRHDRIMITYVMCGVVE